MKRLVILCLLTFSLTTGIATGEISPLKPSEVQEIARVSDNNAVRRLKMKIVDRFVTPRAKIVLISAEGAKPTASTKIFKLANRLLEEVAEQRPQYSFLFPDRIGDVRLVYYVRPSSAKRRYVIFLPWRPPGAPPAFTLVRPEKPFPAVASFFVHVNQSTRFDSRVKGDSYNVFVETCNQVFRVDVTPRSEKKLAKLFRERYPDEQISNSKLSRVIRLVQTQVGQELTCNSLAAAISFARTDIPYKEYRETMIQTRLTALGQELSGYFLVVGPKTYTKFRK